MAESIDVTSLQELSTNIGRASSALIGEARAVIKKGAQNIKDDTRENIPDHYWGKLKSTVNYEIVGLWAEVGYEDRGMGELAGIYEFGSARREPHPTLYPAAGREAPRFEKAMADAAAKALLDSL